MNLKCKINGVEYPIVQGITFSEEYNETLDSATIMISQIPQIKDLKPYDDVFIYDNDFKGYEFLGALTKPCEFGENPTYGYYFLESTAPNGYTINYNVTVYDTLTGKYYRDLEFGFDYDAGEDVLKNATDLIYLTGQSYDNDHSHRYIEYEVIGQKNLVLVPSESYYILKPINTTTLPKNTFYKHFLVDQFSETLIKLDEKEEKRLYKYKIELFSETKGLEVVQLPNISITQPRNIRKRKNVYQCMVDFVELYSPKQKVSFGTINEFEYANKYIVDKSLREKFSNVYSPEFTLNNPNLRDILTQLMLTKDMIPYVEDGVIKGLDITLRNGTFNLDKNCVNYINGSRSSSNHCDNLRRNYTNALSQDNTCRMVEYLGFRNKDNALLTIDNMRLETRYPIYKINKIYMCYYKKGRILVPQSETKIDVREVTIREGRQRYYNIYNILGKITSLVANCSNPNIQVVTSHSYVDNESAISVSYSTTNVEERGTITINYTYEPNNYTLKPREKTFLCKQDITPLVKLNSERALLKADWNDFHTDNPPSNIEELAKYKLCTVGYDIGGTSIEGWGTKYTYPKGWWDVSATYVENILNKLDKFTPYGIYQYGFLVNNIGGLKPNETFRPISDINVAENMVTPFSVDVDIVKNNSTLLFKGLFFQVDYNAFYNGCVVHSKDDGEDTITINDNSSNSLALLENDGLFQKEKINRFGNKATTITARYTDISQLQPLGCVYGDDEIIYHREYNIYDNCINCVYYATKDYVLKNYYTSVYAKHRPYNLMSYGESVNRAENKKVITYLTDTPMYEDKNLPFDVKSGLLNQIFSFAVPSNPPKSIDTFIDTQTINCGLIDKKYLSDVNGFVSGNSLCFNMRMYDNVSGGVYIKELKPQYTADPKKDFTGSVQDWYIDVDDIETGYKENMSFELFHFDKSNTFKDNVLIDNNYEANLIYYNYLFKMPYLDIKEEEKTNVIKGDFALHKDNKETIDMTFQIEPIAKDKNRVVFSQWMMKLSNLLGTYNKFDESVKIEDLYGYESVQKIAYGTFTNTGELTHVYSPLMLVVFDKDDFNKLEKGANTSYATSGQYIFEHSLVRHAKEKYVVGFSFLANNINKLTENDLYISGNQKVTTRFRNTDSVFNSMNTYHFKRVYSIGSKSIPDRYVVFANAIIKNDTETGFEYVYEDSKIYYTNENNEKEYLDKHKCRFNCFASDIMTTPNLFIRYGSETNTNFKTEIFGLTAKDRENKTYNKNMFIVLDNNPIKKEIVYNEYVDLPNKSETLKVSDVIQVVNGKIKVNLINIPKETQSIQYWFLDNILYSRDKQNNTEIGIWNSDYSKSSYKFVFGVNLTEEDFTRGFVEISINALNNRDFKVYDTNHNLIGRIK